MQIVHKSLKEAGYVQAHNRGSVFPVYTKRGLVYRITSLPNDSDNQNRNQTIIQLFREVLVGVPNIASLHEVCIDRARDEIFYAYSKIASSEEPMEVMLEQGFSMAPSMVANIARQLLAALQEMHARGVMHRRIGPATIYWGPTAKNATIMGFEYAALSQQSAELVPVTKASAPEIKLGLLHGHKVDVWGLGYTLASLLLGAEPMIHGKGHNIIPFFPNNFAMLAGKAGVDLLLRMLHPDQSKRITAAEAAAHPWLQTNFACYETAAEISLRETVVKRDNAMARLRAVARAALFVHAVARVCASQ